MGKSEMIKLELEDELFALDGQKVVDAADGESKPVRRWIAEAMAHSREAKDSLKLYDLSRRLYAGPIEVDQSDFDMIKEAVEKSQLITLVKGQLLAALRDAKDAT
jgi:hypothetical protein